MCQVTVTLTFDLLIPKSIGMIYVSWATKTPIMVPLSLTGFKLLGRQGFMLQLTVTLTFDILTSKSIGIIYGSWQTKTLIISELNRFQVIEQTRILCSGSL